MKAIIFDFHGVLTTIEGAYYLALKESMEKHGIELDLTIGQVKKIKSLENMETPAVVHAYLVAGNELSNISNMGYKEALDYTKEILKEPVDKVKVKEITQELRRLMKSDPIVDLIKPVPKNRKSVLKKLSNEFKLGIVSNGRREEIEKHFRKDELELFDVIVGKNDVKATKPSPEGLLKACKSLKINPRECLYVGDRVSDLRAAQRAKMPFLGVLTGFLDEQWAKELNILIFPNIAHLVVE